MRILVVEDERTLAQVLVSALKAEHYEVVLAPTGEYGFFRANGESFDLVLLDLMLPGRNGLEIVQALRRAFPHVRPPEEEGKVGVWTKADSVTQFDDLTVVTK